MSELEKSERSELEKSERTELGEESLQMIEKHRKIIVYLTKQIENITSIIKIIGNLNNLIAENKYKTPEYDQAISNQFDEFYTSMDQPNLRYIYVLTGGSTASKWEDLTIYVNEKQALEASKKYSKMRVEFFEKDDQTNDGGYKPAYKFFKNGQFFDIINGEGYSK